MQGSVATLFMWSWKILPYFVANLSRTLHINFYQNWSSIVEVTIKNFWCVFYASQCISSTFREIKDPKHTLHYLLPPIKVSHTQMILQPIYPYQLPRGKATRYGQDFVPYWVLKNFSFFVNSSFHVCICYRVVDCRWLTAHYHFNHWWLHSNKYLTLVTPDISNSRKVCHWNGKRYRLHNITILQPLQLLLLRNWAISPQLLLVKSWPKWIFTACQYGLLCRALY